MTRSSAAMKELGQRIKQARKAKKITQDTLSKVIGIACPTLNKYENGHRVPDTTLLQKIYQVLECDPGWLLSGKGSIDGKISPLLTEEENNALHMLGDVTTKFFQLPVLHQSDQENFILAIHAAQNIIMSRPSARSMQKDQT